MMPPLDNGPCDFANVLIKDGVAQLGDFGCAALRWALR
jgi:hypothetical protein